MDWEEWISRTGTRWIEGGKGHAAIELHLEGLLLGHERGDAGLRPKEVGRARKMEAVVGLGGDGSRGGRCWRRRDGTNCLEIRVCLEMD